MKGCILKPIIWNTNNYTKPSGYNCHSGFPEQYGFGHEEWNNDPRMVWHDWRIFHSQSQENVFNFSRSGELLILMTAFNAEGQFAVGIAAGVYHNSEEEMETISKDLNFIGKEDEIWDVDSVRKSFENRRELSEFWAEASKYIQWKCPQELYYWFTTPIRLDPQTISGKNKLACMYSSYQAVPPETISNIVEGHLPEDSSIWDWLAEGSFDPAFVSKSFRRNNPRLRSSTTLSAKRKNGKANSCAKQLVEYWVFGKRIAEPRHAFLQSRYVDFLRSQGLEPIEDQNYVDVQYVCNGEEVVFAEIKPTKNVETKYAIRAAIGQLFEYQYKNNKLARLEVVLGSKPTDEETCFVKSLGMSLRYYNSDINTFEDA